MKIAHICTNNGFIDGWGYQDNLLPQYIKREGVSNIIIAATKQPTTYLGSNNKYSKGKTNVCGVTVYRLKSILITNTLVITFGLFNLLKQYSPDIIMHHNLNFTSLVISSIYCFLHRKKMIVDNHADIYNSPKNKLYQLLYYTIFIGTIAKLFSYPIKKFYGVSMGRCDFLRNIYKVSIEKIDFLPLGIDVDYIDSLESKYVLRNTYGFSLDYTIIISGGKMGIDKGTITLVNTIEQLNKSDQNIKLILFGKFTDNETKSIVEHKEFVTIYGWCDRKTTLELLKLSDIACWPTHHTTLCEDAIGCHLPLILQMTRTTEHLIDGNGYFLQHGTEEELTKVLRHFLSLTNTQKKNLMQSTELMRNKLSYVSVAQKLIKDCKSIVKSIDN